MILPWFPATRSFAAFAFLAKTVAALSQNSGSSSSLSQTPRGLVGSAVQLLQCLALHLRLHLRALLEDLRIALPAQFTQPISQISFDLVARQLRQFGFPARSIQDPATFGRIAGTSMLYNPRTIQVAARRLRDYFPVKK
ncbi:MAG: hypothetical protein ACRD2X_09335 [Vicinamibacteraceae bacterium]